MSIPNPSPFFFSSFAFFFFFRWVTLYDYHHRCRRRFFLSRHMLVFSQHTTSSPEFGPSTAILYYSYLVLKSSLTHPLNLFFFFFFE